MAATSIGIMNEAYFVGRKEIVNWINETFELNYSKIEDCGTGAIHCQIMDKIYPGKVPISRVNFGAKHEYESVDNFKIVQNVFDKLNITKVIPVSQLIKCKYQDNLEFMQFMYSFYKANCNESLEYHPRERRSKSKGINLPINNPSSAPPSTKSSSAKSSSSKATVSAPPPKKSSSTTTAPAHAPTKVDKTPAKTAVGVKKTPVRPAAASNDNPAALQERQDKLNELMVTLANLEKEKQFYYNKLVQVEEFVTGEQCPQGDFAERVKDILFAEDN